MINISDNHNINLGMDLKPGFLSLEKWAAWDLLCL